MNPVGAVTWYFTPGWVVFALLAVGATVILAFAAWRRSGFALGAGLLEALRVVLVALAALALFQPEWTETIARQERAVLAVLRDVSGSVETRDMISGIGSGRGTETRAEWLERQFNTTLWDPLREHMDVIEESFSATDGADGTDLHGALESAFERHPTLRAIVLASDGDWNTGASPVKAASRLRARGVPVFAVGVGRETPLPDVEIASLEPPAFSVVGRSLQVPFSITSTLPRDFTTTLTLSISGSETVLNKEVNVPAGGNVRDMFFWTPGATGEVELKLDVPHHGEETRFENNTRTVSVAIREESLKVLVIESTPRWEYRYLRNALERDPGVEVSCLLLQPGLSARGGGQGYLKEFPPSEDRLAHYDVIFLGDVGVGPDQLTVEQCAWLKGMVESQASGLVFLPGFRGGQFSLLETPLGELYPVTLDPGAPRGYGSTRATRFLLTESGRRSLLTKLADTEEENDDVWRSLPGLQWRSPARRSKAGTEVLAIDAESRAPLIVTKTYGTGKILFMGTDSAWRWREGVEDRYHYRFWGQVARWMAYQRHMAEGELLRLFHTPDRPRVGRALTLHATVLDPTGAPFSDGTVRAEVAHENGATTRIAFQPARGDWGLYTARFTPAHPGEYGVHLTCEETSAKLETRVVVRGETRERVGKPARFDVLREVAQVSRGEWIPAERIEELREKVLALPQPAASVRRVRLWASPYWASSMVLLLAVFWIGRKLRGTI